MKNSVLVSYSRQNRDFVDQFINRLTDEKREVWIDKEDILYTEEWWQAIKRGIEASDIFVTVLSPPYMASPVCNLEMRYARRLNKRFVPILFADINETQQKEDLAKRPLDSFEQSLIAEVPNSHLQAIATENWLHIRKFNWVYIRSART
ncbi:MAG: toll/interleukin-1 receptor domain-containing protein [Anaerolineae bacterium]